MNITEQYHLWLEHTKDNAEIQSELLSIAENDAEISDRFYRDVEFGTGGLRGKLGAGTNRMNLYTVAKATAGLAKYLLETVKGTPTAAIAYDSRIHSDDFAKVAADTLASYGVTVHLYPRLMPTPALSFAVRELHCDAGIVITASHNPAVYNGYKVYGADGCQITLEAAEAVFAKISETDFFSAPPNDKTPGEFHLIPETLIDKFIAMAAEQVKPEKTEKKLSVVYTPLNGAGFECVTRILHDNGFNKVTPVPEQMNPDGNFPTCPYPNPEIREALEKGLALCAKTDADLLLATDPDCDRVGIAVKQCGAYELLNGNEVGVLLFDYLCKKQLSEGKLPEKPVVVKTIVTTDMAYPVAQKYGAEVIDVLTGFKFIGEQIALLEEKGEKDRYLFGFEESYGYLCGSYVRDKDGVSTALLICEAAEYYLSQGKTLIDAMRDLYLAFGFFRNKLYNFTFEGSAGFVKMQSIMEALRKNAPAEIDGNKLTDMYDYQNRIHIKQDGTTEALTLPVSDVLKFCYENDISCVVRPSGTEPKLKLYCSAKDESIEKADRLIGITHGIFYSIIQ